MQQSVKFNFTQQDIKESIKKTKSRIIRSERLQAKQKRINTTLEGYIKA